MAVWIASYSATPDRVPHAVSTFPELRRRRGGRRKGERATRVYGTAQLMVLFDCSDVETLLARMAEVGLRPHVSTGDGFVADSDYAWPSELKEKALRMFPRVRVVQHGSGTSR